MQACLADPASAKQEMDWFTHMAPELRRMGAEAKTMTIKFEDIRKVDRAGWYFYVFLEYFRHQHNSQESQSPVTITLHLYRPIRALASRDLAHIRTLWIGTG